MSAWQRCWLLLAYALCAPLMAAEFVAIVAQTISDRLGDAVWNCEARARGWRNPFKDRKDGAK